MSTVVLDCNPTGIHPDGERSVLVDFASPGEAVEFVQALRDARLAKTDPNALGEQVRARLGYNESMALDD